MNDDRNPRSGQVPLPGFVEPALADGRAQQPGSSQTAPADRARQTRTEGLRRVRRVSNWTAAALIVGTGATAVALAHNALPATAPTLPASAAAGTTGTAVGTTAATNGATGPHVAHSVATTSASGVTTTTTTHVVNGKTVVSKVRHVPAYHDN